MKKLYFGGDIISMKAEDDMPEAVAVENGKIIYTGALEKAEELCGPDAEKINLAGKTLMPSFIDPHSHFSQVAQSTLMCDLSETGNFEEIYNTLKAYMEKNAVGEEGIIFASGYDHNFLEEGVHPDKHNC